MGTYQCLFTNFWRAWKQTNKNVKSVKDPDPQGFQCLFFPFPATWGCIAVPQLPTSLRLLVHSPSDGMVVDCTWEFTCLCCGTQEFCVYVCLEGLTTGMLACCWPQGCRKRMNDIKRCLFWKYHSGSNVQNTLELLGREAVIRVQKLSWQDRSLNQCGGEKHQEQRLKRHSGDKCK